MGVFDFFKKGPSEAAIMGQVRKVKEHYAQSDYRRMAMDKLLKWDTDESLKGLLERFCVVVQSPHWDEEEKKWLVQEIVKIGDRIEPILRNFILEKNEVNHALLAYEKVVADEEAYIDVLVEALKRRLPSDHRTVQSKKEIISALNEKNGHNFDDLLRPYLNDHSDDVQCAAIDSLRLSNNEETKKVFIELLSSEMHSARVLRAVANAVCDAKMNLGENVALCDSVKEDFKIEQGFLVRLNSGAKE